MPRNKTDDAIRVIIDEGLEPYAIIKLAGCLQNKVVATSASYREACASLRAIRKINAGINQAIDAMCEKECELYGNAE